MLSDASFAHFKIIKRLGYGGMATVYQAEDTRTDTTVALKILHDQYVADAEIVKRFNREADIFYRLQHPHIVPIIDHGSLQGKFYIAMAYMSGGTLFERFGYQKEVHTETTLNLLTQVASALDFAHEQGVIHRDLKLENILLDEEETAYLTDFGIAFLADATRLTSQRLVAGTPLYMSPEQGLGLDVTTRSDIYSLGVMAYLMLTGYFPFTGHDPYTVINQHISTPPPLPTAVNHQLPGDVNPVLMCVLDKTPTKRFRTAGDFIGALQETMIEDAERTQTMIRLNALNPQAPQTADEFAETVIGGVQNAPVATPTPSPLVNRRILVLGSVLVVAIMVGLLIAMVNGNADALDSLSVAQTQVRYALELDLTATALGAGTALTAVINKPDGGLLKDGPERNADALGVIPNGETVTLIGRTGPGDFIEIETQDGLRGFIKADQLSTPSNLMTLMITHRRTDDPNRPPPPDVTRVDCDAPLTTTPFGDVVARGGAELLAEPRGDADILMIIPLGTAVKLVSRDEATTFIQVEWVDENEINGFVLPHHIQTTINLNCLALREN